jgi:hypothetical protein
VKRWVFKKVRKLPYVRNRIRDEVSAIKATIEGDMDRLMRGEGDRCRYICTLPCAGLPTPDILAKIREYMKLGNYTWENGYLRICI